MLPTNNAVSVCLDGGYLNKRGHVTNKKFWDDVASMGALMFTLQKHEKLMMFSEIVLANLTAKVQQNKK